MKRLFSCAVILLSATCVFAGAWVQPRGGTYAKVSSIFYDADEVYNDMGVRQRMGMDDDQFTSEQAFLYVEHGVLERLTLIGTLSGGVLTSTNRLAEQKTTGIGDATMGAKYQLVDRPFVMSPMLSMKIPTGYHKKYEPPLGTGEFDAEARLLFARSLYPMPVYIGIETGYRWRGGPFSNQLLAFAEVGGTPHERVFLKGFVDQRDTRTGKVANVGLVGGGLQVSEGDDTRVGINGAVRLRQGLWLDVLMEWPTRGENVGAGASWGVGISYGN